MSAGLLDIVILLVIGLSMLIACWRGFIKEFFTLGAIIVLLMAEWCIFIKQYEGLQLAVYCVIFLFAFIIFMLMGRVFSQRFHRSAGGVILDQAAGFFFGIARGFVIVLFMYIPIVYMVEDKGMRFQGEFPNYHEESAIVPALDWVYNEYDLKAKLIIHGPLGEAFTVAEKAALEMAQSQLREQEQLQEQMQEQVQATEEELTPAPPAAEENPDGP